MKNQTKLNKRSLISQLRYLNQEINRLVELKSEETDPVYLDNLENHISWCEQDADVIISQLSKGV